MTGTVGIKADFLTSKHKRDIERIALSNNLKLHYFTDTADMDAVIGQCEILYGYIPRKSCGRQRPCAGWPALPPAWSNIWANTFMPPPA